MIAVLDAGTAMRMVMDPFTPFRAALESADMVIVPELIVVEICSAFHKYVASQVLSRIEADEFIVQALALVDRMEPLGELVTEVLALAARSDSSFQDLFYLALAKRKGAVLLTADAVLRPLAVGMGVELNCDRVALAVEAAGAFFAASPLAGGWDSNSEDSLKNHKLLIPRMRKTQG